jgi:S-adenosylmethionine:tRNA ribosyltransferase-isomerase
MLLSDFDYNLPDELIASQPPKVRGTSKLMVLNRDNGIISHNKYSDFVKFPQKGDVVVFNNTKVINARVFGFTEFGGKVEVMFLEEIEGSSDMQWKVLVGNTKRVRNKKEFFLGDQENNVKVEILENLGDGEFILKLPLPGEYIFQHFGHVPLPRYIKREDTIEDQKRYQTVFAKNKGAVAAPTASLNMTEEMLEILKKNGVEVAFVNLKVSWDTFKPVRSENLKDHEMHSEFIEISEESAEKINSAREVWAIGTTVVRTLESVADEVGKLKAFAGRTKIFIFPGYKFKLVDHLLTNFHAPKTTVLMMASAFAGKEFLSQGYQEALLKNYKFLSYGDSMLIV